MEKMIAIKRIKTGEKQQYRIPNCAMNCQVYRSSKCFASFISLTLSKMYTVIDRFFCEHIVTAYKQECVFISPHRVKQTNSTCAELSKNMHKIISCICHQTQ